MTQISIDFLAIATHIYMVCVCVCIYIYIYIYIQYITSKDTVNTGLAALHIHMFHILKLKHMLKYIIKS